MHARALVNRLNGQFRQQIPEAVAVAIMPPSIPGLGSQGGFSIWIQDRSGGTIEILNQGLETFLAAARQRPELAGVTSPFTAAVPRSSPTSTATRRCKAGHRARRRLPDDAGVPRRPVRESVQPVRQAVARVPAGRRDERASPDQIASFYVRNDAGTMVPLSSLQSNRQTFGPQFTNRFNVYRAAQITGAAAPGYSSGQAMAALEEVAQVRRCRAK